MLKENPTIKTARMKRFANILSEIIPDNGDFFKLSIAIKKIADKRDAAIDASEQNSRGHKRR